MAHCSICGKPAGLFRKTHKECEQLQHEARERMADQARDVALGRIDGPALRKDLELIAAQAYAPDSWVPEAILAGWERAVERALEDSILTEEEERALQSYLDRFNISPESAERKGSFSKVTKSKVLRDLLAGKPLEGAPSTHPGLPFNLQKSEMLVWLFKDVPYHELRTRTHYEGRSSGVSVRVMKGVYYRVGAFKGHPVQTTAAVLADTGWLGVTTKHVYFAGPMKSFRIPYAKIVSFTPYTDGIGIQKDGVTAKPQTFTTGDGWFTYNLLVNLSQKSSA